MKTILGLNIFIAVVTIALGVFSLIKNNENTRKTLKKLLKVNLFTFIPLMLVAFGITVPEIVFAATTEGVSSVDSSATGLGYIAAALSTGLATIGAGYAVGAVGSSALGAVSEDPKIMSKTLIFVGLAEGIAIYGLIISILIIGKL